MRVIIAGRLSRKVEDRDQTGFDSQEREAVRWAESNGHEVVGLAADFKTGRSAMMARKNLRPWITEPEKITEYDGIVALKLDRLTRGDSQETADLEAWARTHGKSLMTAEGLVFPCEGSDGIRWDLAKRMAHDEWLRISERYTRMQRTLRSNGSAIGMAPWGYRIEKRDGKKIFAPTAEGRKYIPMIFDWIIEGKSARYVASMLDDAGVKPTRGGKWNEGYLHHRLISNPVYKGQRRNSGTLETEALVSPTTWDEANAAIASRVRRGRGPDERGNRTSHVKPLVAPVCGECYGEKREGCPSGISPLYRKIIGKGAARDAYFYCSGHGPQRKGCGAVMVTVAAVEQKVRAVLAAYDKPHVEREFVPGDDRSDAIAKLREAGAAAMRQGNYPAAMEAMQEAERLEGMPRVAPHWVKRETEQSEAAYFAGLDLDAQRDYLATWDIRVYTRRESGKRAELKVSMTSPAESLPDGQRSTSAWVSKAQGLGGS